MENLEDTEAEAEFGNNLLSYAVIAANIAGCVVVCFLFKLISMTHIHKNCKFLLKCWTAAFLVQFVAHISIFVLNCTMPRAPRNRNDPEIRMVMHALTQGGQLLTTSFELSVTAERIISSIRPERYYRKRMARKKLYLLVVLIGLAAFAQDRLSKEGHHLVCAAAVFILDLLTIVMNSFAVRYCGRRFDQLHGKTTLNARYQVKEACDVANAMQSVYIGSFLLKTFVYSIMAAVCYEINAVYDCVPLLFSLPFEYIETFYVVGFTSASVALPIFFMFKNPRLRRKAGILRQKFWGVPVTITSHSDVLRMQTNKTEGDVYFEKLTTSWNAKSKKITEVKK